jgi:hypothetical protein
MLQTAYQLQWLFGVERNVNVHTGEYGVSEDTAMHLPRGTEENHKNLTHNSLLFVRHSNRFRPEHISHVTHWHELLGLTTL